MLLNITQLSSILMVISIHKFWSRNYFCCNFLFAMIEESEYHKIHPQDGHIATGITNKWSFQRLNSSRWVCQCQLYNILDHQTIGFVAVKFLWWMHIWMMCRINQSFVDAYTTDIAIVILSHICQCFGYFRHLRKLILSMMGRLTRKSGETLFCDIHPF